MKGMEKRMIGRKDKADLPDFGLENVAVKIDSGAYSCSIHCESILEVEQDGKTVLEVIFLDPEHPRYSGRKHYFEKFRTKKVRSSTGHQQERYFIGMGIVLFGQEYITDFSLTRRNGLRSPILLGRKLLNKNFTIDTTLVNVSYKEKQQKIKESII
jgi:hypothetical protein